MTAFDLIVKAVREMRASLKDQGPWRCWCGLNIYDQFGPGYQNTDVGLIAFKLVVTMQPDEWRIEYETRHYFIPRRKIESHRGKTLTPFERWIAWRLVENFTCEQLNLELGRGNVHGYVRRICEKLRIRKGVTPLIIYWTQFGIR